MRPPVGESTEAGRLAHAGAALAGRRVRRLTLFVIVLERQPALMHALVDALTAPLPERVRDRARQALEQFLDGLGLFRDMPRSLWVFLLSFAMFGVVVLVPHREHVGVAHRRAVVRRARDARDHRDRDHGARRRPATSAR